MRFPFQFRLASLPLQLCSVICTVLLFDSCLAWATERARNGCEVQMKKDPCSIFFPVPCPALSLRALPGPFSRIKNYLFVSRSPGKQAGVRFQPCIVVQVPERGGRR